MRTTLDIDEDVLLAAKALARRQRRSAGAVLSELARKGLSERTEANQGALGEQSGFYGFHPLPASGQAVTDEIIDSLRKEFGD